MLKLLLVWTICRFSVLCSSLLKLKECINYNYEAYILLRLSCIFFNFSIWYCFFYQVKVQTWVDGGEDVEFVGVGARFGTTIVSKEKNANQTRLSLSDPRDCCSPLKKKVFAVSI